MLSTPWPHTSNIARVGIIVVLLTSQLLAEENSELLRSLAKGYRKNRDSFETVKCRYRVTVGTSESSQAAIEGKIKPKMSQEVMWVVSGKVQRVSTFADDKAVDEAVKAADQREVAVPFLSKNFLELGNLQMAHSTRFSGATLYGKDLHLNPSVRNPFSVTGGIIAGRREQISPATILDGGIRTGTATIEQNKGSEVTVKDRVVRITFGKDGMQQASEWMSRSTIDKGRGYLMTRRRIGADKEHLKTVYALTDVKKCSNGRWFPKRIVFLSAPSAKDERIRVTELKVLWLVVDKPPAKSNFGIELQAGTTIVDRRDPRSTFSIRRTMTVTPHDLPQLFKRANESLKKRKPE